MGQATLDDDDLFGEAADELRDDIEAALDEAEAALPDADDVWTPAGDNLLGQLNTLRSTLDGADAAGHLREARKWLAVAQRSGAVDEDDELAERVETLEAKVETIAEAKEAVGTVTAALPELRQLLEDA